jgi:hypothetical protein
MKSRVKGDFHARFCGKAGVRFPCLTRLAAVVWMFDDDFGKIGYRYFNSGAIMETESGTYADKEADISQSYVVWNHGLSEVVNSLIGNGLVIDSLDEFDYSPYNCFNKTIEFEPGKFRIEHLGDKIPLVYSVSATKKISG